MTQTPIDVPYEKATRVDRLESTERFIKRATCSHCGFPMMGRYVFQTSHGIYCSTVCKTWREGPKPK